MTPRGVAKRYARALLALAREEGDPAAVGDALGQVTTAMDAPSVAAVVRSPAIGAAARLAVVRRVIENLSVPRQVASCVFLLSERRRLDILPDLWRSYVELLDEMLGRCRVVLRSAIPLSEEQVQQLLAVLAGPAGGREMVPVLEVDPELLGGVVAEVGGVVYDGSVQTQVRRLARRMVATGGA